jgi:signal transduction histidine kinase
VHGRAHFYATPLESPLAGLWVIAFVASAETPLATSPLVRTVAAFTLILVGVAALVAYYLARSVHSDVSFVRDRIAAMTALDSAPGGQPVVVRGVDQVGQLTVAFNRLVERFYAAEEAYRRDLSGALNYERERSDFLAALSHELRTPLNVILGFADVLLSEVDGPLSSEARENLTVVRQSGSHLRSLINDILDLSALETGRLNLQLKKTNLWSIALDVVRESRLSAEAKNLSIDVHGEVVEAIADQLRVRQVLGNLVSNAVKFTSRGGVVVDVGKSGEHAILTVADTGPGIAKEEQAAVFEEYRQSGDWQSRGAGSGLGLAITRRLVRMHGGRIELESKLGEGSRFSVLLPLAGPPDSEPSPHGDAPRGNTLRLSNEIVRSIER